MPYPLALARRALCFGLIGAVHAAPALANLPEEFWARRQSVAIEATGPDALVARQSAIAAGLREAWQAMARQLGMRRMPDDAALRGMVTHLALENERTTPTGFAATLTVEFNTTMAWAFQARR